MNPRKHIMIPALTAALLCCTACGTKTPPESEAHEQSSEIQIRTTIPLLEPEPAESSEAAEADSTTEAIIVHEPEQPVQAPETGTPQMLHVSGNFTATVRKLIPDYVSDPDTPRAAVVTLFQDGPFVLQLDEQICAQLQEDTTYTFIIGEQDAELPPSEYTNGGYVQESALILRHIHVTDFREPTDEEYGLECWRVTCAPAS